MTTREADVVAWLLLFALPAGVVLWWDERRSRRRRWRAVDHDGSLRREADRLRGHGR